MYNIRVRHVEPKLLHLVGGFNPPEKYESQIGSSSQLLGKIKCMFQTTNQSSSSFPVKYQLQATCAGLIHLQKTT